MNTRAAKTMDTLRAEMEALGPWHHKVELRDGVVTQSTSTQDHTGQEIAHYDPAIAFDTAIKHVFPDGLQGRSFLDCGCNCGGYSFAAKDRGAGAVYGFDVRDHWIRQAHFISENRAADSSDIRFEVGALEDLGNSHARYDVTWFSGLFYHLPDPVASLKLAADRTRDVLFLNTACAVLGDGEIEIPQLMFRPESTDPLVSGVGGISWIPSGPLALKEILKWMGFAEVKTYFWTQDTSDIGPAKRKRLGRIAVAAARDVGLLTDMADLKHPKGFRGKPRGQKNMPKSGPTHTKPEAKPIDAMARHKGETRPLRWEDDLSSNARDTAPFEVISPVSEWKTEHFNAFHSGKGPQEIRGLPVLDFAKRDTTPIPISKDREGYCGDNHEWYWLSGLRDFHQTQQVVKRHNVTVDRMLDIGCASGRVLRHFAHQSNVSEPWGCDINHRHIRFLSTHMPPHVRPIAMPNLPHFPVEDNYFDLVTAFSVFTHIDVFETAFLADIRRILKPGGLAYLTISDESHWDYLRGTENDPEPALQKRIATHSPEFRDNLQTPLQFETRYYSHTDVGPYRGVVFTPQAHLRSVWERFFTIEEIIPFGHAQQTVVVLRK